MRLIGLENKKFAVFGLGRSGLSSAILLQSSDANVVCFDDDLHSRKKAQESGLYVEEINLDNSFDFLLLSPGVPLRSQNPHPLVAQALNLGIPIIGDVELLYYLPKRPTCIGITGTNGKSTTTALLTHILTSAGKECAMGGNIGIPVADMPSIGKDGYYVLELSSYQLDLLDKFFVDIGVLINITPDHLDRYLSFMDYAQSKMRIFQDASTKLIGVDEDITKELANSLDAMTAVSVQTSFSEGIFVTDQGLLYHGKQKVMNLSGFERLAGKHNWQNIAFCWGVAQKIGIDQASFENALHSFKGLVHRQEFVRKIDKVSYINDSKATNPESTEKALETYEDIYWLAGGRSKAAGYDILKPHLGNIKKAYVYGEAADEIADFCRENKIDFVICEALRDALLMAHKEVKEGNVLLSPACSSFDQFESFEHRGDVFRSLVMAL